MPAAAEPVLFAWTVWMKIRNPTRAAVQRELTDITGRRTAQGEPAAKG